MSDTIKNTEETFNEENNQKTAQIADENFNNVKKQLKPRMKRLSKNSLIDIALRLSLQVTYLKEELELQKLNAVKTSVKTKKAKKAKKSTKE
jgi:hypothetical protein